MKSETDDLGIQFNMTSANKHFVRAIYRGPLFQTDNWQYHFGMTGYFQPKYGFFVPDGSDGTSFVRFESDVDSMLFFPSL